MCYRTSKQASLLLSPTAALSKGVTVTEVEPTPPVCQNGAPPGKKSSQSAQLPELEYREKGRDSNGKEREGKKQHPVGINNNSIVHTIDSRVQETDFVENHIGGKRLNNDLVGEHTHADPTQIPKEETATPTAVAATAGKSTKNLGGGGGAGSSSSPRSHGSSNGSVPSGSTSSSKNEKKQKGGGKTPKDPVENCIPNNQLGKTDTLVRYVGSTVCL